MRTIAIVLIAMTLAACGNQPNQQADVRPATEVELLAQKVRELETATEFIDKLWKEWRAYLEYVQVEMQLWNQTWFGEEAQLKSQMKSLIDAYAEKAEIVDNALLPYINKTLKTIDEIDDLMRKTNTKANYDYMMINLNKLRKKLESAKEKTFSHRQTTERAPRCIRRDETVAVSSLESTMRC